MARLANSAMPRGYGTLEAGTGQRNGTKALASALAITAALCVVCVMITLVHETTQSATVLDDAVQDPMERQLNFGSDEPAYEWSDTNGDEYDPEKQNVFAEPDAFDPPEVGHAEKSLATAKPHVPEANVLDYLPSGPFTESKSMELRQIEGPADPEPNAWDVENMPLDY